MLEKKIDSEFEKINQIQNNGIVYHGIDEKYLHRIDKYVLEIACSGFIYLLPNTYAIIDCLIIRNYLIDKFAGYNNFLELIRLIIETNNRFNIIFIASNAIINGNLKILKLLKQNEFYFSNTNWLRIDSAQQLKILKWAKNNSYFFDSWTFDDAIKDKHLDILKWTCKNKFIDADIYHQLILNN